MSTQVQAVLHTQIANWMVLYMKLHNYHWFVKGEQFFTLHVKFEELYNEAALHVDNVAERLLALGGKPVAQLAEVIKVATIKEANNEESATQMVEAIIADFNQISGELKDGIDLAAGSNDKTTEDLLMGMLSGIEKHVWLLGAFLGK